MGITPKKIFEAYISEYDIVEYLTKLKLEGSYVFDDAMTDLENVDTGNEDYKSNIGYDNAKLCEEIRNRFQDAWDTIYELLDEILEGKTLYEILNSNHWNIPSRTYKWEKLKNDLMIAKKIILYAENNKLEVNHIEMAKNNKEMFKILFIAQNG